jgi:hypothetical protein
MEKIELTPVLTNNTPALTIQRRLDKSTVKESEPVGDLKNEN